jgi:cellulose biosynthesis protein BcsQ
MTTVVALFNNKGGVGKTTSAYHLAHMSARLGLPTLAVDLDPQANLSSAFFDEERLEDLWEIDQPTTVTDGVNPMLRGLGDIVVPPAQEVAEGLHVLPGDLGLSSFEDNLSGMWPRGYDGDEAALRTTTAFHRIVQGCAADVGAEIAFVDVGPNLGAINRAALLTADHILIPLAADLFSLQGLRNVGPVIRAWRTSWQENVLPKFAGLDLDAPKGSMEPMGYVVLQHAVRLDRPVKAFDRWLTRIPEEFARAVLGEEHVADSATADPHCLATLRNYRSLMPLAQDARKPMFDLRAADGALGSTARLVQTCHREFHDLAFAVLNRAAVAIPAAG